MQPDGNFAAAGVGVSRCQPSWRWPGLVCPGGSFPSGHTLHAVCFTTVICGHIPASGWLLGPFAALVALSRPVLGLHYPSDVLAGAALGGAIAAATWLLPMFPS